MKLLMHTCCAPCSVYCIDELRLMGIEPTLYWYNPNIHPYTEYVARRDCVKEYAKRVGVDVIFNDEYGLDEFCKNVANNLNARCVNYCYPVRLRKTFEYAKANGRKKVTAIHKANIMKFTDGLFLECFRNVGKDYPEIEKQEVIIDNMCMQLVLRPETFDVLVAPNLYGDIVSDLCAGLVGGLGFAPSGNIGDEYRIYEAVHGSAPDIAGKGIANPSALLLAFALMLEALGQNEQADRLRTALSKVVEEGKIVTRDIGGNASTQEFTQAIIDRL